ncbi:hypothetical protein DPMN_147273 [Dreissena polymorpha]|uniref:Uncharacterized protein n=1 Tax=Dreissena polymorpha TaxID=45954 RepID=A0A9D4F9K5_DREPO|nr:hypothetical protein DPMN_147273 [Dreissena polymorpha]
MKKSNTNDNATSGIIYRNTAIPSREGNSYKGKHSQIQCNDVNGKFSKANKKTTTLE